MPPEDSRRRGFLSDINRQAAQLGSDAVRVLQRVARRLVLRQEAFGPLDLAKLGDWRTWRGRPDPRVDEAILTVAQEVAAEDREHDQAHERARDEMFDPVAEFGDDQHRTRLDPTPAVIALCEQPRERDEELEVELQFDASDAEEPIGVQMPDYEGGASG